MRKALFLLAALLLCLTGEAAVTFYPINIGAAANDNTGDTLRTAFDKVNTNFMNLTNAVGSVSFGSSQATNIAIGKTLFVDQANGSDSTGARGRLDKPFLTITNAKNAASSGDLIVVYPGWYQERLLQKNGINFYFHPGATVTNWSTVGGWGIFDDRYSGACTMNIMGHGVFSWGIDAFTSPATATNSCGAFVTTNAASRWKVEADAIYIAAPGFGAGNGPSAICSNHGTNVYDVKWIEDLNYQDLVYEAGSEGGGGIFWQRGDLIVRCPYIKTEGYCFWPHHNGAVSVNNEAYIESDWMIADLTPVIYMDSALENTGWKAWVRAKNILSENSFGSGAITMYSGGKLYVDAERISSPGGDGWGIVVGVGPAKIWVTTQKLSANNTWLKSSGAGANVFLNALEYEDLGSVVRGFDLRAGTNRISGNYAKVNAGIGVDYSGGSAQISGLTIDTSGGTSITNFPAWVRASGLTLNNVVLTAPSIASNFISAPSAQTVTVGGVLSGNKGIGANVTFATGTNFIENLKLPNTAAGSLLRTDAGGKIAAVTIGTNIVWDGTTLSASGGGGTPGGSTAMLEMNLLGVFAGTTNMLYDNTIGLLTASNATFNGTVTATGLLNANGGLRVGSETPLRAAAFDISRGVVAATATRTELDFLSGVTSALQTQLNGKQTGLTNANQFGASTNLTIKDGVLLTNASAYGFLTLPSIGTPSRVLFEDAQRIVTNVNSASPSLQFVKADGTADFPSNNVRVAAGVNVTVTPSSSSGVMTYTIDSSGGGGGGEANVNMDISATNIAGVYGWVYDKSGVSNRLRTATAGYGLSITNQGTNLIHAVLPIFQLGSAWGTNLAGTGAITNAPWTNSYQSASSILTNLSGTGAITNIPASTNWEFWIGTSATNDYRAKNQSSGLILQSNDFGALLQYVVNVQATNGSYLHFASSPYYTAAYVVTNTVIVTNNWLVMLGDGNPATVFRRASAATGPMIQFGTASASVGGISRIDRIRFESSQSAAGSTILKFVNDAEPVIESCEFNTPLFAAVQFSQTTLNHWSYIHNSWFVMGNASSIGVLIDATPSDNNSQNLKIDECIFGIGDGSGIVISNRFRNIAMDNNIFRWTSPFSTSSKAIDIAAGENFLINNNIFHDWPTQTSPINFRDAAAATNYNAMVIGNIASRAGNNSATNIIYVGTNIQGVTVIGNYGPQSQPYTLGGNNKPFTALDASGLVSATNVVEQLKFAGGQATNSFLYLRDGTNVAAGTFGSGLTFASGTLTSSGTANAAGGSAANQFAEGTVIAGTNGTTVRWIYDRTNHAVKLTGAGPLIQVEDNSVLTTNFMDYRGFGSKTTQAGFDFLINTNGTVSLVWGFDAFGNFRPQVDSLYSIGTSAKVVGKLFSSNVSVSGSVLMTARAMTASGTNLVADGLLGSDFTGTATNIGAESILVTNLAVSQAITIDLAVTSGATPTLLLDNQAAPIAWYRDSTTISSNCITRITVKRPSATLTNIELQTASSSLAAGTNTTFTTNGQTITLTGNTTWYSNNVLVGTPTYLQFDTGITGTLTGAKLTIGTTGTGSGTTNNVVENEGTIILTNQILVQVRDMNTGTATTNVDLSAAMWQDWTNVLSGNLTINVTNSTRGGAVALYFVGAASTTNRITFNAVSGGAPSTNILWQSPTNIAHDGVAGISVYPGETLTVWMESFRQTNIAARYIGSSPYRPAAFHLLSVQAGFSQTNAVVGGCIYYNTTALALGTINAALTNVGVGYTIPAHTMTNLGDTVIFRAEGVMPAGTANTNQLSLVASNSTQGVITLADTGLQTASNCAYSAELRLTRTGPSAHAVFARIDWGPGSTPFPWTNSLTKQVATLTNGLAIDVALLMSGRRAGGMTNTLTTADYRPGVRQQ